MKRLGCALLTLALLSGGVLADSATVYKTVDEQGNVSFSDTPPADGSSTETIQYRTATPSDDDYQQRLDDMRETTDRMAADRREREQHRAELRRQSESEPLATNDAPYNDDYLDYPGGYGYGYPYPVYNNRPHHHRPHPRPPRPPLAKPASGVDALRDNLRNNSQLMRPILPRRGQ